MFGSSESWGPQQHGAGSMLVSTVGRGLFINLNFEPSIRGNPSRIIEDTVVAAPDQWRRRRPCWFRSRNDLAGESLSAQSLR
jgi:hypothetical protein